MNRHLLLPFALPALLILIWELCVRQGFLHPLFFPLPSRLPATFADLWQSGELPFHIASTLRRLLIGFFVGGAIGFGLGVLMGINLFVRRAVEPMVSALYTTPKITLLPLVMLLLGIGESSRLLLICLAAAITMAIQSSDAVRQLPPHYLTVARSWRAPRSILFRRILVPAVLPQLYNSARLTAGRALIATTSVEIVGCPDGLGSMIWMAWQTLATSKLYLGIILIGALGFLTHSGFRVAERYLIPWRAPSRTLARS